MTGESNHGNNACDLRFMRDVFGSGMHLDNVALADLAGIQAGPCPRCGNMGHIPDGSYKFIGDVTELLRGATARAAPEIVQSRRLEEYR